MTRVFLFFMWLVHFLPLPVIEAIGRFLGGLIYYVGRRQVTRTNLALCFPKKALKNANVLQKNYSKISAGRSCKPACCGGRRPHA